MKNYFKKSEFKNFPARPLAAQLFMLNHLRDILNMIRAKIKTPIIITDCYRTLKKFHSLKKRGYNPSTTSDHFWGLSIPTFRQKDKAKWGSNYFYAVGAVDLKTPKADEAKVFKVITDLAKNRIINIGQAILEYNDRGAWIHLSNPKDLIFDPQLLRRVGAVKYPFLISRDNGKTYRRA